MRAQGAQVEFEISQRIAAPRERVWMLLVDWERQAEWMLDAKSVEVLTPQRDGVGVTIRCPTALLGVPVEDIMRVTRWVEETELEVLHLGRIIRGSGRFLLEDALGYGTLVTWQEEIEPPFGALGEWSASRLARPVLERIFARSLRRFATMCELYPAA